MGCVRPKVVNGNIVPCGYCHKCRKTDRNNWSIRTQHTIKDGTFITLTIAPEHYKNTLVKQDLKDYLKRLREHIRRNEQEHYEKHNFKYFATGEYGDRFGRGHYHIICNYKNHKVIKEKWNYGHVYIGNAEGASINYSTKYIQKTKSKNRKEEKEEEFRLMSKGLGKEFIEKHKKWFRENRQLWLTIYQKGKSIKYPLPRYYKEKFFKSKFETIVDKETGEITVNLIEPGINIEKEVNNARLNAMKKLKDFYAGLLPSEKDKELELRFNKYNEMYKTLKTKRK